MGGIWAGGYGIGSYATSMIRSALMVSNMIVCSGAFADPAQPSLCGPAETPLFTCSVGKKIVSVCSGAGKATYYFGVPGKVEMSSQALSFADHSFSGGGETQISVKNKAYSYTVYDKTTRTSFSSEGHNDPDFGSGLVVQKNGKTISAMDCSSDATISANAAHVIQPGQFVEH